ncbi:MAG: ABC transporter ATP-binding protein, partial [Lachnospiraceae bacterium]|nr:ABC transporter ATP-binding protein [Lachnospiraceae bacterium]
IKDKTVLVIAHRMRTVIGADKVVVLSDGRVAEQGTSEELMKTGTIYPHMYKLQTISQDWGI